MGNHEDADVMDVGVHCQLTICNTLDFLPFVCGRCRGIYCRDHRTTTQHSCEGVPDEKQVHFCQACKLCLFMTVLCPACKLCLVVPTGVTSAQALATHLERKACQPDRVNQHICAVRECGLGTTYKVACSECHNHHCLKHRHTDAHACTATREKALSAERKKNDTETIVKDTVSSTAATNASQPTSKRDSKKPLSAKAKATKAKVQLMKLKMSAKAASPVTAELRIYLMVEPPVEMKNQKPVALYFDEKWSIGRTIDQIATVLGIPNNNNTEKANKLLLYEADTLECVTVSSTLKDDLTNGQSIRLEREEVVASLLTVRYSTSETS